MSTSSTRKNDALAMLLFLAYQFRFMTPLQYYECLFELDRKER